MAHVDIETTGLVPGYHEMIDVGIVMTDLRGKEIDRLFLRVMPNHPGRAQAGAVAVNGFSVERWNERGNITPEQAVDKIVDFHRRVAGDRHVLFVGYNAWFDLSFIDHLFRQQGKTWRNLYHYFVLDLPSMAWSLAFVMYSTESGLWQYLWVAVAKKTSKQQSSKERFVIYCL